MFMYVYLYETTNVLGMQCECKHVIIYSCDLLFKRFLLDFAMNTRLRSWTEHINFMRGSLAVLIINSHCKDLLSDESVSLKIKAKPGNLQYPHWGYSLSVYLGVLCRGTR